MEVPKALRDSAGGRPLLPDFESSRRFRRGGWRASFIVDEARQHRMIQQPIYADQVYRFLAELLPRTHRHGDAKIRKRLERAMLHYTPAVTSEFLGVSMTALQEMLLTVLPLLSV